MVEKKSNRAYWLMLGPNLQLQRTPAGAAEQVRWASVPTK
jgi:hypothetical protein